MPCFAADGQVTIANAVDTVLDVYNGGTTRRIHLYDIVFGTNGGTWADSAINWIVQRHTGSNPSGGAAVTPRALDPGDGTALSSAMEAPSTEPTTLVTLLSLSVAMRIPQRWVAREGRELKAAAAASSGLGMSVTHASYTGNADVTFHFEE